MRSSNKKLHKQVKIIEEKEANVCDFAEFEYVKFQVPVRIFYRDKKLRKTKLKEKRTEIIESLFFKTEDELFNQYLTFFHTKFKEDVVFNNNYYNYKLEECIDFTNYSVVKNYMDKECSENLMFYNTGIHEENFYDKITELLASNTKQIIEKQLNFSLDKLDGDIIVVASGINFNGVVERQIANRTYFLPKIIEVYLYDKNLRNYKLKQVNKYNKKSENNDKNTCNI